MNSKLTQRVASLAQSVERQSHKLSLCNLKVDSSILPWSTLFFIFSSKFVRVATN